MAFNSSAWSLHLFSYFNVYFKKAGKHRILRFTHKITHLHTNTNNHIKTHRIKDYAHPFTLKQDTISKHTCPHTHTATHTLKIK